MIKLTKNMFEILTILFSSKNLNLNSISRKSGISVMGVSKIIKKFKDADIVDVVKIGKSSVVNLNLIENNLEIFALAEKYKTEKFLKTYDKLKSFLTILREKISADCLLIFGSYASGEATSNSDLDLLIINPKKDAVKAINEASVLTDIEIIPIFVSRKDFIAEMKKRHRLYTEILNGKRVLIKGEYNFWRIVLDINGVSAITAKSFALRVLS